MPLSVVTCPGPLLLLTCFLAEENSFLLPFYGSKRSPGSNHRPTKIISQIHLFSLKSLSLFNTHTSTHRGKHTHSHTHTGKHTHELMHIHGKHTRTENHTHSNTHTFIHTRKHTHSHSHMDTHRVFTSLSVLSWETLTSVEFTSQESLANFRFPPLQFLIERTTA